MLPRCCAAVLTGWWTAQVLDARDPLGCRCREIEQLVLSKMQAHGTDPKILVLVLNKIGNFAALLCCATVLRRCGAAQTWCPLR